MTSIIDKIRQSLALKTSVSLAIPMVAMTAAAAAYVTQHQTDMMEEMTFEKAKVAAKLGAHYYGEALEHAIDTGVLTVQDVFDQNYQEIAGYNWGENTKYHTKYDFYTDHTVLRFQDAFLENNDFVFAVGEDVNGYLPTHNSKYQQPVTGDPKVDNLGNRTKRIFNDKVGIAAAKNTEEILVQDYHRDTGERMWDVSAPVYVKGKHWGAFRLAVSMERIQASSRALLVLLSSIFVAFGASALGLIIFIINRAMAPVERLTAAAMQISLGEGLGTKIKPESDDEVGRLARSVDRLRISMKAAMGRLGE